MCAVKRVSGVMMKTFMILLLTFILAVGITYASDDNDAGSWIPGAGGGNGFNGGGPEFDVLVFIDKLIGKILPYFSVEAPGGLAIHGPGENGVELKREKTSDQVMKDISETHWINISPLHQTEIEVYANEDKLVVDGGYVAQAKLKQVMDGYIELDLEKEYTTESGDLFLWLADDNATYDENILEKWLEMGVDAPVVVIRNEGNVDIDHMMRVAFSTDYDHEVRSFGFLQVETDATGNVVKKTAMLVTRLPAEPGTLRDEFKLEAKSVQQ